MRTLSTIVALGALAGCGDGGADGPEIATRDMGIQVFGVIGAADIAVTATLTTREPGTDELRQIAVPEGDRLIARVGEAQVVLEPELTEQGAPTHRGVLAGATGAVLEVSFERAAGQSAPSSTVALPAPFELIAPPLSHTRGAPLTIDWEAGEADTIRVLLAAPDCVAGSEVRFDEDLGTATLEAPAFAPTPTTPADQPCAAGLQVDRLRDGTADPAFGRGGRVEAVVTRGIELTVEF